MYDNDRIRGIFHDVRSNLYIVETFFAVNEKTRKSDDEKELFSAARTSHAATMEMVEELYRLLKETPAISGN